MRISDWSSDVCSSDLSIASAASSASSSRASSPSARHAEARLRCKAPECGSAAIAAPKWRAAASLRSEERRGGERGVSTWCFWWMPAHYKKKQHNSDDVNTRAIDRNRHDDGKR